MSAKEYINVGTKEKPIWQRKQSQSGGPLIMLPRAKREDSLDDFLAQFHETVAVNAAHAVKAGRGSYNADIPGGGRLEEMVVKKAEEVGVAAPSKEQFVADHPEAKVIIAEQWPDMEHAVFKTSERELRAAEAEQEKKDSASVFSKAAESVRSRITRSIKPDGVADLPPALLLEETRQKRERVGMQALDNSSKAKAQRAWGVVRSQAGLAARRYIRSNFTGAKGDGPKEGHEIFDSAYDFGADRSMPLQDQKEAKMIAVVEASMAAYKKEQAAKKAGESSGEKRSSQDGEEGGADDAASIHSRAPLL
ncbi:hypothetical protein DFJ74DRAFT_416822 [Hyaloraphidium curvatum]|nr:hypothetical protein DFJ74DRAFT_416822 [Hyaloraphidium curvatum]